MLLNGFDFALKFFSKLVDALSIHLLFQAAGKLLLLEREFLLDAVDGPFPRAFIDLCYNILGKVQHAVQVAAADIQQQPQIAWHAAGVPDMRYRRGEFNMPHPFAANSGARNLNAALVTDDAAIANVLVFATVTLPVAGRAEDPFAK